MIFFFIVAKAVALRGIETLVRMEWCFAWSRRMALRAGKPVVYPKQLRKRAAYVIEIKALAHLDPIEAENRIDAYRHWMRNDFPENKRERMEIEHQRALLIGRILRTPVSSESRRKQLQQAIAVFPLDQKWLMDLFNAQPV